MTDLTLAISGRDDKLSGINAVVMPERSVTESNGFLETVIGHRLGDHFDAVKDDNFFFVQKRHGFDLVGSAPFGETFHLFQIAVQRADRLKKLHARKKTVKMCRKLEKKFENFKI